VADEASIREPLPSAGQHSASTRARRIFVDRRLLNRPQFRVASFPDKKLPRLPDSNEPKQDKRSSRHNDIHPTGIVLSYLSRFCVFSFMFGLDRVSLDNEDFPRLLQVREVDSVCLGAPFAYGIDSALFG
jgi:hypothetical protein